MTTQIDPAMNAQPINGAKDFVVRVSKVSKKYCRRQKLALRYGIVDFLRLASGRNLNSENLRPHEFWATRDVSFQLERGESIGLVGTNGSGKTTLLRMVCGLIRPDMGQVETIGRVVGLFAKGPGFNPVLSGRENVVVYLSMLGLPKKSIVYRMNQVIEFSELELDAIDAPVKSYSSGMFARLGFAASISADPDIVIVDEALAVGDMRFRAKCYRKLVNLRRDGVTFVVVSHSLNTILSTCDKAIYLDKAHMKAFGPAKQVVTQYEDESLLASGSNLSLNSQEEDKAVAEKSADIIIRTIELLNGDGKPIENLVSGETAFVRVRAESALPIDKVSMTLVIRELSGELGTIQHIDGNLDNAYFSVVPGEFCVSFKMDPCALRAGLYALKLFLSSGTQYNMLDAVESFRFKVVSGRGMIQCLFYQPREWGFEQLSRY